MSGKPEAVNELLRFTLTRVPQQGLHRIFFGNWKKEVVEIEPAHLTGLVKKAAGLEKLGLGYFYETTDKVKKQFSEFIVQIISKAPPMVWLGLEDSKFDAA